MSMSAKDMKTLLDEAEGIVKVFGDAVMCSGDRTSHEMGAQALMAHAVRVIQAAKAVAWRHKIELHFAGTTLRYPEDCEAGYMLDEGPTQYKSYEEYKKTMRDSIEPKFLGDNIWSSSENCSDQGFGMFLRYDDFARNRGDSDF